MLRDVLLGAGFAVAAIVITLALLLLGLMALNWVMPL